MKPGNAVSLIEAAYRIDLSTQDWLQQVAAASAAALGSEQGALAFRYDVSGGDWVYPGPPGVHGLPFEFVRDFFNQSDSPPEVTAAMTQQFRTVRFGTLRALIERIGFVAFARMLDRHGIGDLVGVNGADPSGRGCMLVIADRRRDHPPRTVHLWHRLATHISAGSRLRTTLAAVEQSSNGSAEQAEAVLSPTGKIEHAVGPAEPRSAREALREALRRIDAARSESADEKRSVDLWRGLVAGRWSLVEHFESDGRRYYLAHKNDPELKEDRALTLRERQVLGYAELGNSNKVTAYALGISSSTVSTLLARARRKIGLMP